MELPQTERPAPVTEHIEGHLEAERRVSVIGPAKRWPHLDVRELWHYREVALRLVWRDIVVRYKQTFLGVTWALLVPALTTTVYVVVFGKFAKFPHGNTAYPALTAAGVIPMQYFASALTSSSTSLVTNLPLVTKVYFPRILLPLAAVVVVSASSVLRTSAVLVVSSATLGVVWLSPMLIVCSKFLIAFCNCCNSCFLPKFLKSPTSQRKKKRKRLSPFFR